MQRPVGITILAILAIIGGVFGLCGGVLGIVGGGAIAGMGALTTTTGATVTGSQVIVASVIALVLGVLDLILGIGALQLKPWAWTLGVGLMGVSILDDLYSVTQGNLAGAVLGIIISAIILYYLFRPDVRKAFGR